jgi:type II restriction enzyme
MNLSLYKKEIFEVYKSNSQRVRVLTESWMTQNMFCPVCSNKNINAYPNNYPVADYFCPHCKEQFQLKSQKNSFGKKINDGAYKTMIKSIQHMIKPNFFLLRYNLDYYLTDLMLIPGFFFTESLIEQRKPLSDEARRAGWIGCNILLDKIPPEGRIKIIEDNHWIKKEII